MTFDQTAHFNESRGQSQQGAGGRNHNNNCVPTSFAHVIAAYGHPWVSPQHITDVEYGTSYLGIESWTRAIDYFHRFVDGSMPIGVDSGDVLAVIDRNGSRGWPTVFLGHCDSQGNYAPRYTGIAHASVVLRRWANFTVLLNSEWDLEVGYTDANMRAIYAGSAVSFGRALPSPSTDLLEAVMAAFGPGPATTQADADARRVAAKAMLQLALGRPGSEGNVQWLLGTWNASGAAGAWDALMVNGEPADRRAAWEKARAEIPAIAGAVSAIRAKVGA